MRDDDAAVGEPKTPDYGAPTGPDAALPLYGSSDSVEPIEHSVSDFDPRAAKREKARAARAAAEARKAEARRAANEAKAEAAALMNAIERKARYERTQEAHAAGMRRRSERTLRSYARPPAWALEMQRERLLRMDARETARQREKAVMRRRVRIALRVFVGVLIVAGATTAIVVAANPDDGTVSASGIDWSAYPGYDSTEFEKVTEGPSQEEVVADGTAMLDEVRAAISDEVGIGWLQHGSELVRARENAWDGPSLLNDWKSAPWYSTDPLTGTTAKQAVVDRVSDVLEKNGYESISLMNDPAESGSDDELLEQLFGGTTLENQVVWKLTADRFDGAYSRFELRLTDLAQDTDGRFTELAEYRAKVGEIPVNSIAIEVDAYMLLPAAERDEYVDRAERFVDEKPPPAL